MNIIEETNKKKYLLLFCEKYYVKYDLTEQRSIDTINYIVEDSNMNVSNIITNYRSLAIKDIVYFIENTGGGVIQIKNGFVKRIDNSYSHRLQFGSFQFVYDNKLHQYGGYGFFSNRDFITYFDTNTKSWEIINPIKSDVIPIGTSVNTAMIFKSNLYLFNGSYLDKFNRKKNHTLNEVWNFDFLSYKWKKIGKTRINENVTNNRFFQIDNKIIVLNYGINIAEIDIEKNNIKKFKKTNFIEKLSDDILPIYKDEFIYCILNNSIKNTLELHVRKKDDFLGDFIDEEKLYNSSFLDENKLIIINLLIFLIVVIIILLRFKNKKTKNIHKLIKIKNNNVFYKNKLIDLDESEVEIIKILLEKPEGVSTSEILNLTETKGLNYSHNIRQKNIKINNINLIFKATLKIDYDIITSNKSDFDQRMRIYKIKING